MSDFGKADVQQSIRGRVGVITSIKYITAIVKGRIVMVWRGVAVGLPSPVHGTGEDGAVGACGRRVRIHARDKRTALYAGIRLYQFFIPPPDVFAVCLAGTRKPPRMHTVGTGSFVVAVPTIQNHGHINLFEVAQTLGLNSLGFGTGQRGQQHRREYGDNGDDDEQFNQSKPPALSPALLSRLSFHFPVKLMVAVSFQETVILA